MNLKTSKVIYSRHVIFDESKLGYSRNNSQVLDDDTEEDEEINDEDYKDSGSQVLKQLNESNIEYDDDFSAKDNDEVMSDVSEEVELKREKDYIYRIVMTEYTAEQEVDMQKGNAFILHYYMHFYQAKMRPLSQRRMKKQQKVNKKMNGKNR